MSKGKIITIEGSDGSGKKTQKDLLVEVLNDEGYKIRTLSFPDYSSFFGKTVREYLDGKFGKLNEIHPKLSALPYSLDRFQYKDQILNWLNKGGNWIFDRYMESNWAHQASRLDGDDRNDLIDWLRETETSYLGLPQSDLVIYLDLPIEWSQEAMKKQNRKEDIHESNLDYQLKVHETYRHMASVRSNWVLVNCLRDNHQNLTKENQRFIIEELNEKLLGLIYPHLTKSKLNFYFATTVMGDRSNLDNAKEIVRILKNYGVVLSEHLIRDDLFEFERKNIENGVNIYERDINWVNQSDYVIVEGSGSSFGIGREVERAVTIGTPVLFLYRKYFEDKISRMALHDKRLKIVSYAEKNQLENIIQEFLSKN